MEEKVRSIEIEGLIWGPSKQGTELTLSTYRKLNSFNSQDRFWYLQVADLFRH